MTYLIRQYSPDDRNAIRHICCETGFSGDPVDPLFSDRDVFADFFTRYYTDFEPDWCWVIDQDGAVTGYLTACVNYKKHFWVSLYILYGIIAPKVAWRMMCGCYNRQDYKFLWWSCVKAIKETPAAPKNCAHFHFNVLPDSRGTGAALRLFKTFMAELKVQNIPQVYGQIQTRDHGRTEKFIKYYGFKVLDKKPVSKFQDFHQETVYVTTAYKLLKPETE